MRVNVTAGTPNASYVVQATTNLVSWTAISTNTADATGAFTYTDTSAGQFPKRFYRTGKP